MSDWTTDSNECLSISLVRSAEDKESLKEDESYDEFHPAFTYPIFGEEEKIYGYKDLTIDLKFASGSLSQYLSVKWSDKLQSVDTVDNVDGTIREFLAEGIETDEDAFQALVEKDATSFKPSGEMIYSYTRSTTKGKGKSLGTEQLDPEDEDAVVYEVYHNTWNTPGFREYHRKMQIFILLYIEAGSYINEEEEGWEFVVLYEKRKRRGTPNQTTYHFMGYSSLYNFYYFPEKVRLRLSQFVILGPYQRSGHGSELYRSIYQYVLSQPHIGELTVEDPAEAFEDLRDKNDLKMLLSTKQFMEEGFGQDTYSHGGGRVGKVGRALKGPSKGKMGPPVDKGWAEKWRLKLKIAGRQFQRLVEMLIQMHLDPLDARGARAYRLQVKERLYRFNFEVLAQMEKEERLEKLEETFQSVREDYDRILKLVH
ncbi:acyl-CoA N-acyltransferase [Lentinula raphanica]|uniref:Histone acetyltransferase type B catalytic subunit n=1 Tax=Lentinula raphanica TaxID=153919 RepID=A0AA38PIX1_9AGAR|nr:acyl-CoA N-acyltransferase [Lentinula raphanica]KAJ3843788.1 acyl-CoA N-acyltransferase [Lentinula raphanica]KAJ3976562.1 acyl-CoA N-acyltransferase [Lentinula raphanica]